ncbi:MAG TPA: TIGR00366 family protein, partial [Terriglobia bacterium]|nr:TIGR00366 family protein [Terriglobia bacterium]
MQSNNKEMGSWLPRIGLQLSNWFERWFPDAFALATVAVAIVFAACLANGSGVMQTAQWFGSGFWDLMTFTLQVAMIIITGYAVATAPPVFKIIYRLAGIPRNGRNAIAFVALFSMLTSMLSWSFSLIFSALLAREVAHRVKGSDYRSIGAAAYLGVGSIWALGMSSSAALIMATPASLPQSIMNISGVIPIGQTLGLWQSLLTAAVLLGVSMAIAFYSAPADAQARGMSAMGVEYAPPKVDASKPERPGEWLEYSPLLTLLVSILGIAFLGMEVSQKGLSILLDLNH